MSCKVCASTKNKNLSSYFTEYSENTSIHGIKFLGERKRNNFEKIFWVVVISLSLYFCIDLCHQTYTKWRDSPVMVSFATSETPIWKIPFPAVTICPRIKAHKRIYDVVEKVEMWRNSSLHSDDNLKLNYFSPICPNLENMNAFEPLEIVEDKMIDFLVDIAPNVSTIFHSCQLFGRKCDDVNSMFVPLVTNGGVCYTFNMMDRSDMFTNYTYFDYYDRLGIKHQTHSKWSIEDGYSNKAHLSTYPKRTYQIGNSGGLDVVLRSFDEDIDIFCGEFSGGFKVILHHPVEIPRFRQRYFWVPLNQLVTVSVKPNMITTSKSLTSYDPEDRKCYFAKERRLKFFKVYNQQNCLLECLAEYTYKMCGCVKFHMPRNKTMPICGPKKSKCTIDASNNFLTKDLILTKDEDVKNKTLKHSINCNCLPSCFALNFDAETSQLNWFSQESSSVISVISSDDNMELSKLRIFFKDMQFMTSERRELYGKTEFLANCGGLLGLFTGFSIISLVEILYFVTLRLICNVRRFGVRNWSGSDELREVKIN